MLVAPIGSCKVAVENLYPLGLGRLTSKCPVQGRPHRRDEVSTGTQGILCQLLAVNESHLPGTQRPIPNTPESRRGTKKLVPDGYDELDKRHDVIDQCGQRCTRHVARDVN